MNLTLTQLKSLKTAFRKEGVVFAYLFGSQATGDANSQSDFDFAVMLSDEAPKNKRFGTRLKIISGISRVLGNDKVEVVVLNDLKDSFFEFVIVKEGKIIFEHDHSARVDFEMKAMNEYYDFSPFLDRYNQAFLKRELASAK